MYVKSVSCARVLFPLLLGLAPSVTLAAHAPPAAPPAQAAPRSNAETEDLAVMVDFASLGNLLWSQSEQAIAVMYRDQLMTRANEVALEKKYPGITQARVDAALAYVQQSFVADLPRIRADYETLFRRELTASERAEVARYMRSPFPQRLVNARIAMQVGETTAVATQRTFNEIAAEKTTEDTRLENAFAASAAGKKYGQVMEKFQPAIIAKQQAMTRDRLQAALGRGEATAQTYMSRGGR